MRTPAVLHIVAQYACITKSLNTNTQMSAWTEGEGRLCLELYVLGADRGVLGLFGRGHRPGALELPMQVPQACTWRLPGQVAAALSWKQVLNTRSDMLPEVSLFAFLCGHFKVTFTWHGRHANVASMTADLLPPTHIQVS